MKKQALEDQISLCTADCTLAENYTARVEKENARLQAIVDRQEPSALGSPEDTLAPAVAAAGTTQAQVLARCQGREDPASVKAAYQAQAAAEVTAARAQRQRTLGIAVGIGALVGCAAFVITRVVRALFSDTHEDDDYYAQNLY